MEQSSQEKGALMERAVAAIESAVLEQNPELRGHKLTIECRKTVVTDEVRHEIDLFVTIPRGDGYDAVFIFECKNQLENVGKNDIIIFSEKIHATNATRGFFVATGFGAYAQAQAQKDSRLILLHAAENRLSIGAFEHFCMDVEIDPKLRFTLRERDTAAVIKPASTGILYCGKRMSFDLFMRRTINRLVTERLKKPDVNGLSPGIYTLQMEGVCRFAKRALVVDERDIEAMNFKLKFGYKRFQPRIVAGIEVCGRGRYVEFEDMTTRVRGGHETISIKAVALPR